MRELVHRPARTLTVARGDVGEDATCVDLQLSNGSHSRGNQKVGSASYSDAGGTITMDPTDTQWDNNEGMKNFRAFVDRYMPGIDIADTNYLFGYTQGMLLEHLIKQCGDDLSRENIIKQAKSLKNVVLPTVLPGIKINTSDKINMNYTQMRLQRWTGTHWHQFSDVLDAASE